MLILAALLMLAAFGLDLSAQWAAGLRPRASSYGAAVYVVLSWQGFHAAVLLIMACYVLARSWCGLLDAVRRATFDNVMLFWSYTVGQGLAMLALIHLFPRLAGP